MSEALEFCLSGKKLIIECSRSRLDFRIVFSLKNEKDLGILRELAEFSKTVNVTSLNILVKEALADWVKLRREGFSDTLLRELTSEIRRLRLQVQNIERMLGNLLVFIS